MKNKKIAIIGVGGFGREVLWLIMDYNSRIDADNERDIPHLDVVGFIDDDPNVHNKVFCDIPVLGSTDWLLKNRDVYAVCSVSNPRVRIAIVQPLENQNVRFCNVIHPTVKMSQFVKIGDGSVICAGTIITTQVNIGNHVHINLNSTIGHDVVIEDFVTIAPAVNVSGNVHIGLGADIGTNSSIIQKKRIGKGSIVGAGAVVNRDIEENVLAVGVPVKSIKKMDHLI